MNLFRLLYTSRATAPQNFAGLLALQEVSQAWNERNEITGLLYYIDGHFSQFLEGPRTTVNRLMGQIYRDTRHTNIVILDARRTPAREFPDWWMKLVVPGRLPVPFLWRFTKALGEDVHGPINGVQLFELLRREAEGISAATAAGPAQGKTEVPIHSPQSTRG